MKLVCNLKNRQTRQKDIVLLESDDLDYLKEKAVEYASTNPSFCHGWKSSEDRTHQELFLDLDYRLEIRP